MFQQFALNNGYKNSPGKSRDIVLFWAPLLSDEKERVSYRRNEFPRGRVQFGIWRYIRCIFFARGRPRTIVHTHSRTRHFSPLVRQSPLKAPSSHLAVLVTRLQRVEKTGPLVTKGGKMSERRKVVYKRVNPYPWTHALNVQSAFIYLFFTCALHVKNIIIPVADHYTDDGNFTPFVLFFYNLLLRSFNYLHIHNMWIVICIYFV